ncbi:uncharacterized protein I303_104035 [Kwoniella dejecticola CBS 10117]|uniref:Uncharacterized protein n=1 Tax=Kwoniella dejecticola CBS 10117 TaxID=1296121 RepID=A0A1A6A8E7_9TREE|nr:uncharacterized protein I303_04054 [Kwoniella dejecticola CBS 10117]OBR86330.1 hypothetical protein I303_04054 [Kwoniella dejecticola CBS 10117]
MRPSQLLRATHYKPSIHFLGQRKNIRHAPHAPAAHPCAPPEIVDSFQSFLAKLQSTSDGPENPSSNPKAQTPDESSKGIVKDQESKNTQTSSSSSSSSSKTSGGSSSGKPVDFENFWEAPSYLWTPKEVTERELDAVMSGGATDVRTGP